MLSNLAFDMHIPVLQKEVLEYLDPKPNENFIDGTCGGAGHTLAILEKNGPQGKVLGIDQDPNQIKNCQLKIKDFKERVVLVCDNFANLKKIVDKYKFKSIQGILLDLGMSSWHLAASERGFTFKKREPLDMRYDPQNQLTAEKIINFWSKFELERILNEYGEEQFSKKIAEEIINARRIKPIKNTVQLVEIIKRAVPYSYQNRKIHLATKTFQALRIAVNDELNNLKTVLPQSIDVLKPGGRIVVISFHSLEDRIVKIFFREQAKEGSLKILTKKPISPLLKEVRINPRARSAKLRSAIKIFRDIQ